MTRAIFGILAILAGITLIRHFWPRRRYIIVPGSAKQTGSLGEWVNSSAKVLP